MFPLGSVLFPHMPLHLRVFEPRYAVMLAELMKSGSSEFGVVLIERGQEVGGGEHRFGVGTVAEITDLQAQGGMLALAARGARRITVQEWFADEPYPRADVADLPPLEWRSELEEMLLRAEQLVRRTLAVASEFEQGRWPPDIALDDDPLTCTWQLAGVAPLSALDQIALLHAGSVEQLLADVIEQTTLAAEAMTAVWPDQGPPSEWRGR